MIDWKCPECNKVRTREDNVLMVVCECCQIEMVKLNEVEKNGDRQIK